MERRREVTLPDIKRDKGQPEIGEERFQYVLQLLTTYEQNVLTSLRAIATDVDTIVADLRNSISRQDKLLTDLADNVTAMEKEMVFIMQLAGYVADGNGNWARPNIPPRLDEPGRLAI